LTDYKDGIYCVDAQYEGEGVAAVYIVRGGGRAAIVDTGANSSFSLVKRAMNDLGVAPGDVDYVFLTHVHLDHAGGAGLYMRNLPAAKLVVHERGARHMVNPERLMSGTREIYGAAVAERLYGDIIPVPEDRVIAPSDGETILVGDRPFVCLETPGHALHHIAYHDPSAGAVFTGDAFGMSYLELTRGDRRCVIPTTSPVQFDPRAMRESIDRIAALRPKRLYLTHFGELTDADGAAFVLRRQIDAYERIANDCDGDIGKIRAGIARIFEEETAAQNNPLSPSDSRRVTGRALELNAQGVALWFAKQAKQNEKL
jgi:glyoxylase-like metal-dependent hydrolase (beta-lactamase superfamily II)